MGAGNKLRENNKVGTKGNRGRPKGSPNKTTAAVKDMILEAVTNKGGVGYFEELADKNPTAFAALVGKIIPLDVNNKHSGSCRVIHVPVPKTALDQ